MHLRHPRLSLTDTAAIIEAIPQWLRHRISLHDHHILIRIFPELWIHLNSRNPEPLPGAAGVSRSCHSLAELNDGLPVDYSFLSPIFDSISKQGYTSAFSIDQLRRADLGPNTIALGGVTPARFPLLKGLGFAGAAMLGHFWKI